MLVIKDHIRTIPDFPKPGILFYDIGSLLAHTKAWQQALDDMEALIKPLNPDFLLGIEARGFLIGAALAARQGCGFLMARKKGKLPGKTSSFEYELEYGSDIIEMQEGLFPSGAKVLVIDDLLATGGTAKAAITLARKMGADVIAAAFLLELTFLEGRKKLDVPVHSLIPCDE